jgi:Transposase DDE domain
MRLWHKGGASKSALALALLSDARHRLRCRPEDVLFAAWYPSKALLKRVRDYGWDFICRLTKNRRFNHQPLRTSRRHPYWAETGRLSGGLKGLVVRDGATSFATNRLTLPAAAVRRLYRVRAHIEAIFRACKDQLGLNGCQTRTERAQRHHLTCGLVAFCVLERERLDQGLTIDHLRRQLSGRGHVLALPALERLRQAA